MAKITYLGTASISASKYVAMSSGNMQIQMKVGNDRGLSQTGRLKAQQCAAFLHPSGKAF
ncbi:hypothetical protein ACRTDJ_03020 [Shewanella algae]